MQFDDCRDVEATATAPSQKTSFSPLADPAGFRRTWATLDKANGSPADEKPKTRFRLGPVFDRSQVDPLPAPAEPVPLDMPMAPVEGDHLVWAFPRLVELAEELNVTVAVESMPEHQGGCCVPESRTLAINERKPVSHRVKTILHEHCTSTRSCASSAKRATSS